MNDNRSCEFSKEELQHMSVGRCFDRITVVTRDLERVNRNLSELYGLAVQENESTSGGRSASARMGDVELRILEPGENCGIFTKYIEKYGSGICCVRERVGKDAWSKTIERLNKAGSVQVQAESDNGGETLYFDALDIIGGIIAIHQGEPPVPGTQDGERKITQLNVVTDNVDRTVGDLTRLLGIGPWSIGTLDNKSVTNPGILVEGELCSPEFHFQLGITFYSNIEFEVIEPVKGPTVYKKYLDRHGIGFHHIKEVIPPENWEETLGEYKRKGMKLSIKGQVGPTKFAYLDSEKDFDFIVEFGDGIPADPLPEGYNEYTYPA